MTEPSSRELNDKIAEIREWLVRIDTKVDMFHDVKRVADEADAKADKALMKGEDNEKAIESIRTTTRWAIGLTITSIAGLGSLVIAIVNL